MAVHRLCEVEGCDKRASIRSWCHAHYARWKRHGDPTAGRKSPPAKVRKRCVVTGCDRDHQARGLCFKHYKQWEHHGFSSEKLPRLVTRALRNKRVNRLGYVEWNDVSHPMAIATASFWNIGQ